MADSINTKLGQLAQVFYISHGTPEQKKIDASVDAIKRKLRNYFGPDITEIIEFGSYKRDTILPRKYDDNSDVDLMVVFNHASLNVQPGTYRNYLINFADDQYSRSEYYKSTPTVVLELSHIKYDLVPTYVQTSQFLNAKTIYIPKSEADWMVTDPYGFNKVLDAANSRHNWNIKRVIRLLKAWNAKVGYPISSFDLEKEVAGMSFFFCRTLEDYFFYAIDRLSSHRSGNVTASQKIQSLKENAKRVKTALQLENTISAYLWLAHILPL